MPVRKTHCPICKKDISNSNYRRHSAVCSGPKIKKVRGLDYDPNHGFIFGSRSAWNKGLTKETSKSIEKYAATQAELYANGLLTPSGYRGWTPEQCRENAKAHKTGGYRENAGRSKKFKVMDSFGKMVCLQSSYELKCSIVLDQLGIRWIRPKHLLYGGRKYFPDFYLVDHEIYLDPKNPYLMQKDRSKITLASIENDVIIHMLAEENICKDYILQLLI